MSRIALLAALLLLLAGAATAQSGSVTPFATGCKGQPLLADRFDQTQSKWVGNLPTIGQSFSVSLPWSPNDQTAFLLVGKSNTSWKGLTLPIQVPVSFTPVYQLGPCLLTSIELFTFGLLWSPFGTAQIQRWLVVLPIPNDPTLVGMDFHVQWVVYQVNFLGGFQSELAYSAGATCRVGK